MGSPANFLTYSFWFITFSLSMGGCATSEYNTGSHTQDLMFYSTESEISMGESCAKAIAKELKISNDPKDIKRVNDIGKAVSQVCDRKELTYYFYVILDEKEKNAFSAPGGYIYIFKKLLDDLNDEELAFVLAHEVAHVVSRHVVKKLQGATMANVLAIGSIFVPSSSSNAPAGVAFSLAQIIAAYSREDELNADELAVKYTQAAGFDPKTGIEVMEKLYKESKKEIQPISYFRTHPYTAQRIRHIKETLRLPLDPEDYINIY